jgi:hypothetical protein
MHVSRGGGHHEEQGTARAIRMHARALNLPVSTTPHPSPLSFYPYTTPNIVQRWGRSQFNNATCVTKHQMHILSMVDVQVSSMNIVVDKKVDEMS